MDASTKGSTALWGADPSLEIKEADSDTEAKGKRN